LSEAQRDELARSSPEAWMVSCKNPSDVADVRARLIDFFESFYVEGELLVPYDRQRLVSQMHDNGKVLEQNYEDSGVRVRLRTDPETLARLRAELG